MAGFDLAGPEEGFAPEVFRAQFDQLARLHIPVTAHAGENAPPGGTVFTSDSFPRIQEGSFA